MPTLKKQTNKWLKSYVYFDKVEKLHFGQPRYTVVYLLRPTKGRVGAVLFCSHSTSLLTEWTIFLCTKSKLNVIPSYLEICCLKSTRFNLMFQDWVRLPRQQGKPINNLWYGKKRLIKSANIEFNYNSTSYMQMTDDRTCLEGLSFVHKEVNLSLGVEINIAGSRALLFENLEVISWYSSATK